MPLALSVFHFRKKFQKSKSRIKNLNNDKEAVIEKY